MSSTLPSSKQTSLYPTTSLEDFLSTAATTILGKLPLLLLNFLLLSFLLLYKQNMLLTNRKLVNNI